MSSKKTVKFVFDNEEAANHFLAWLCNCGEQSYWDSMECREGEEDGDITVVNFDYWNGTQDGAQFGTGDIICKCGRLNRQHPWRDQ